MKKKIVGILVVMLLIATAVLPVVNSEDKNYNSPLSDEIFIDDYDCDYYLHSLIGGRFYVMSDPYFPTLTEDDFPETSMIDLPDYFNWMDHEGQDWTTPAKDQKMCGSCWDFAAIGALESTIKIKEGLPDLNVDLSEQYVLSCLPAAANYYGAGCQGGDPYNAYYYIMNTSEEGNNCNGIIPESCFPYQADHNIPCDDKCENWEENLVPITDCKMKFWGNHTQIILDKIKTQIMLGGPVASGINVSDDFNLFGWTHHDPTDYFPYTYEKFSYLNHIIVIVGWKDDPSIGNGGYWICKNSRADIFGYNGFFNIEYGGLFTGWYVAWADYDPESFYWSVDAYSNGPYYSLINEPVQFSGNAAAGDPPYTWHWDFGDDITSEEQNPSHTYTSPGEYVVSLTVTDDSGDFSTDFTSAWIQESNSPPNPPIIDGPTIVKPGKYYFYSFSAVDPDGSDVYLYMIAFEIDCGVWWGPYEPGEEEYFRYYWSEKGKYTVKAKAKDPYGAESDWATLEVTVPKNKEINTPFLNFLENHPLIYQLLQRFFKL